MLSIRFDDALALASDLHRRQTRKGDDTPYLAHLMTVAACVLEHGGDEDTAIAALLHDAVEDQGGVATAALIRERFGDRVAEMVLHCSDSVTEDAQAKPPWRARKNAYVARLAGADRDVALIVGADKLHNITATLRDLRRDGPATLQRFAEPDQLAWYYAAVAETLAEHHDLALVAELRVRVAELRELLAEAGAAAGVRRSAN